MNEIYEALDEIREHVGMIMREKIDLLDHLHRSDSKEELEDEIEGISDCYDYIVKAVDAAERCI